MDKFNGTPGRDFCSVMAKMDEMNHRKDEAKMKKDCNTEPTRAILGKKGAQLPTSASMDNDDLDLREDQKS